MKFLTFALIAILAVSISADNYAVLIAGSNHYYNYRHHADVCHAYQLLLNKNFNPENIIVFAYDDVANDKENPYPGQLFNKPSSGPGVDVYNGCVIDYKGSSVTPQNYIEVITGGTPKGGNGRVLKSGSGDNVFLAFFDHGAPGLIGFPSSYLYAKDLLKAFESMNEQNMYSQLTYYLEACESGSMFENLPADLNIYAVSAANAKESSWGTYCGSDAMVDGKNIGSCLGDLFSISWMEDSDNSNTNIETLQKQYKTVKARTNKSHVLQWGDKSFTNEPVGDFLHMEADNKHDLFYRLMKSSESEQFSNHLDSREIKMNYLASKFNKNPTQENYEALQKEMNHYKFLEEKFEKISNVFQTTGNYSVGGTDFECYEGLINRFEAKCGKVNENGMRHFAHFYEYCQRDNLDSQREMIIDIICE